MSQKWKMGVRLPLRFLFIGIVLSGKTVSLGGAINGPEPGPKPNLTPELIVVEERTEKDGWDEANVLATGIGAIGAFAAAVYAAVATKLAKEAAKQTNEGAKRAEKTARDQRLAELFADIQQLEFLSDQEVETRDQAVGEKVVTNLGIMEKIAFAWHRNLVDREAVEEQVRPFFVKLYNQIVDLGRIESLARDGKKLISQSPLATKLKNYLEGNNAVHTA